MNKLIQELAEQAWNDTAVSPDFGHPHSFAQRLSKLIVQQCIEATLDYDLPKLGGPGIAYANAIRDKFEMWDEE